MQQNGSRKNNPNRKQHIQTAKTKKNALKTQAKQYKSAWRFAVRERKKTERWKSDVYNCKSRNLKVWRSYGLLVAFKGEKKKKKITTTTTAQNAFRHDDFVQIEQVKLCGNNISRIIGLKTKIAGYIVSWARFGCCCCLVAPNKTPCQFVCNGIVFMIKDFLYSESDCDVDGQTIERTAIIIN